MALVGTATDQAEVVLGTRGHFTVLKHAALQIKPFEGCDVWHWLYSNSNLQINLLVLVLKSTRIYIPALVWIMDAARSSTHQHCATCTVLQNAVWITERADALGMRTAML